MWVLSSSLRAYRASQLICALALARSWPAWKSNGSRRGRRWFHFGFARMVSILVAEDSLTQCFEIRRLLEDAGFEVRVAHNGREALGAVEEDSPAVVLTDLDMPEMNGLELVNVMRREHPGVPVVLMTAYGSEEIAVHALQRGAASYVPKKSLSEDLISTLEDVIEVAQANREESWLAEFLTTSRLEYVVENPRHTVASVVAEIQDAVAEMGVADEVARIRFGVALESALRNFHYLGNLELSPEWLERGYSEEDSGREFARSVEARAGEEPFSQRKLRVVAELRRDGFQVLLTHDGPPLAPEAWRGAVDWQGLAGHERRTGCWPRRFSMKFVWSRTVARSRFWESSPNGPRSPRQPDPDSSADRRR